MFSRPNQHNAVIAACGAVFPQSSRCLHPLTPARRHTRRAHARPRLPSERMQVPASSFQSITICPSFTVLWCVMLREWIIS